VQEEKRRRKYQQEQPLITGAYMHAGLSQSKQQPSCAHMQAYNCKHIRTLKAGIKRQGIRYADPGDPLGSAKRAGKWQRMLHGMTESCVQGSPGRKKHKEHTSNQRKREQSTYKVRGSSPVLDILSKLSDCAVAVITVVPPDIGRVRWLKGVRGGPVSSRGGACGVFLASRTTRQGEEDVN
jgi:hypothetical protein